MPSAQNSSIDERSITLGPGLPPIPERLLLAHARGETLFIAGAGASQPASLPDFRGLVLRVYPRLDAAVHAVISDIPREACNRWAANQSGLNHQQAAEVSRFIRGDYDVVLGMLEFDDLKERYTFVSQTTRDPIDLEDWKGRGITPIPYDPAENHTKLLETLERWADLSANHCKKGLVEAEVKRVARMTRNSASDSDRDLFDHLIRRSDPNERIRLSELASKQTADLGWLDAIAGVVSEKDRGRYR